MIRRISGSERTRASSWSATYTTPAPRAQPTIRPANKTSGIEGRFAFAAGGARTWAVIPPKSLTSWACLSWSTTE